MSLALLFQRTKPQLGGFEFDMSVREDHTKTSRVTARPVEDGSDATDHIANDPDVVVLEVVHARYPDLNAIGLVRLGFDTERHFSAWQKLRELRAAREPVDVFTSLESYTNMAIESIRVPRDAENSTIVRAQVTLRKIRIAHTALVQNLADAVEDLATKGQDLGTQGTQGLSPTDSLALGL